MNHVAEKDFCRLQQKSGWLNHEKHKEGRTSGAEANADKNRKRCSECFLLDNIPDRQPAPGQRRFCPICMSQTLNDRLGVLDVCREHEREDKETFKM